MNASFFDVDAQTVNCRSALPERLEGGQLIGPADRARGSLAMLFAGALVAGMVTGPSVALAQSRGNDPTTMTVEELEAYIAEQKEALERVRENREITAEKAREVREELAQREAKRAETEAELRALCEQREEIEPGSLDDCMAQIGQ